MTHTEAAILAAVATVMDAARADALEEAERVLRDFCDKHGPSGGAWNISMLLDAFAQSHLHKEETNEL